MTCAPRLSCMSGTYGNSHSRTKILQAIAWSFQVLRTFHAQFELLDNSVNHPAASICHPGTGIYPAKDPWNRTFDGGIFSTPGCKGWQKNCWSVCCCIGGHPGRPRLHTYSFPAGTSPNMFKGQALYIYIYIYIFFFFNIYNPKIE